jgi:hypothetical protein
VDKKVISNAVAAMMLAADYLKVLEENDGLLKAKNHLIGENRKWREALGRKTSPPDPNTARPDDVVDLMILRKDYRKLHSENAKLKAELETVSADRFRLQVEKDARTVADDPDFEVADAPVDKPDADSRIVIDKLGLPRQVGLDSDLLFEAPK